MVAGANRTGGRAPPRRLPSQRKLARNAVGGSLSFGPRWSKGEYPAAAEAGLANAISSSEQTHRPVGRARALRGEEANHENLVTGGRSHRSATRAMTREVIGGETESAIPTRDERCCNLMDPQTGCQQLTGPPPPRWTG